MPFVSDERNPATPSEVPVALYLGRQPPKIDHACATGHAGDIRVCYAQFPETAQISNRRAPGVPRKIILLAPGPIRGSSVAPMGTPSPKQNRKNRITSGQFFVAHEADDLYDSRKASKRVPRQDMIAMVRAIILVATTGGLIWFFLWKLATHFVGKR